MKDPKGISRWVHHSISHSRLLRHPRAPCWKLNLRSLMIICHLLGPRLGPRGKVPDSLHYLQTPGVEGRVNEGQVGKRGWG